MEGSPHPDPFFKHHYLPTNLNACSKINLSYPTFLVSAPFLTSPLLFWGMGRGGVVGSGYFGSTSLGGGQVVRWKGPGGRT